MVVMMMMMMMMMMMRVVGCRPFSPIFPALSDGMGLTLAVSLTMVLVVCVCTCQTTLQDYMHASRRRWYVPQGFYFWLDVLCVASLIPDIGWLWAAWTGHADSRYLYGEETMGRAVRAGKLLHLGVTSGRFVRFLRWLRVFAAVKLVLVAVRRVHASSRMSSDGSSKNSGRDRHRRGGTGRPGSGRAMSPAAKKKGGLGSRGTVVSPLGGKKSSGKPATLVPLAPQGKRGSGGGDGVRALNRLPLSGGQGLLIGHDGSGDDNDNDSDVSSGAGRRRSTVAVKSGGLDKNSRLKKRRESSGSLQLKPTPRQALKSLALHNSGTSDSDASMQVTTAVALCCCVSNVA